ncbi:MAG: DUF4389 domain-containing protein [Oleispira sp.]|nr:DUF4389 domain-containing protein [Oleispira sp.]
MSDIKQSIESDAFWMRTLFIILFSVVYRILDVVVLFLVLVQWGFSLATGQVNPALSQFSAGLASYIGQIVRYITGNTETKPFPFTDWPTPKSDMPTEQ